MPTNLPPDYFEVEQRFREAETVEERIILLKEMISIVPKHKGTDHLRADLRRRLARLNDEAQTQKAPSRRDSAFRVPRAGAAQIVIAGPPGVGKTTLFRALTGSASLNDPSLEPAYQPTFEPSPGMLRVENVPIQVIDTPPLSREYFEPRLKDLIRRADLALLVVDLAQDPVAQLLETAALLEEFHIVPRHRQDFAPPDPCLTRLPFLALVNKCDLPEDEETYEIFCQLMEQPWPCLPVSAQTGHNLERLKKEVFQALSLIRVYTKAPGKAVDYHHPFVFRRGVTLEELAGRVHKDFLEQMKSARVWGAGVHDGQQVSRDYLLQDGDVVEIQLIS